MFLVWAFARFAICFFIFKYPLFVTITSLLLDWGDFLICKKAGFSWSQYSSYDKTMDYWWYLFILFYSLGKSIASIIIVLFVFRTIGQYLIFIRKKEIYFTLFPNVLESFFTFYVLAQSFPYINQLFSRSYPFNALLISFLIAIVRELYLHTFKIRPENLFSATRGYSRRERWV